MTSTWTAPAPFLCIRFSNKRTSTSTAPAQFFYIRFSIRRTSTSTASRFRFGATCSPWRIVQRLHGKEKVIISARTVKYESYYPGISSLTTCRLHPNPHATPMRSIRLRLRCDFSGNLVLKCFPKELSYIAVAFTLGFNHQLIYIRLLLLFLLKSI